MSDQQIPHSDPVGSGNDPSSKQATMNDAPPVADTPDVGSDFYTPVAAAGTPVTSNPVTECTTPAPEPSAPSQPAPAIPGLGLVNNANDQPTTQDTTNASSEAVKQEKDVSLAEQQPANPSVDMEDADPVVKQSLNDTTHDQSEQVAAHGEAMEVDHKPDTSNTENTDGLLAAQGSNEQPEEEHPEWEVDSSPYESSSDSSTSTDSDDSDDEDYPILNPEEQARILMLAEAGSDDEGDSKGKTGGYVRSTNEVAEDVLPIPDVKITPEMNIVYLGKVQTVIDNAVLIEANTSGEYQVLEAGSLLCSAERQVMGVVSETLGRVEKPLYTVMYSTAAEVQERGLTKEMAIYYVEGHCTFVFTQPLKGLKGSDASNFHDEEVAEDEIEFSDDEAEAEYKKSLKQKRQERKDARGGGAGKGKRTAPGPSKLSHTELNYDDEGGEDGYTPLARPKNLHEMMGPREAPVEGTERGSGFRGGRGRGRGGRGRGGGGRGGSFERDHGRRPQQQQNEQGQSSAPPPQASGYGQPYQQQPAYGMPQPFAGHQQYPPQQQAQYPQAAMPNQFPFQYPFQQQGFAQPNPFQPIPSGAHINPLFLAALQQQQQQQQQQQYQQPQQAPAQSQQQPPAMNFDQVKAQLDLLRNLSNGNQGPPPT